METPAEITHLPALHSKLAASGIPLEAREWLIKALHPVATVPDRAVPDRSTAVVALPTYRESFVVGPARGIVGLWDAIMIQCGGDCNLVYWATGPAGTDFGAPIPPLAGTYTSGVIGVQQARWLADVLGRQATSALPTPYAVQQLMPAPWRTRARCMSMTTYLTASALNNQGTVYAAQVPSRPVPGGWRAYPFSLVGQSGSSVVAGQFNFALPLDENTMQLVDPKCYVAPAVDGAYCVSRFLGDTYPFTDPFFTNGAVGFDVGSLTQLFASTPALNSIEVCQLPVYPAFTSAYRPASGIYPPSWVPNACLNPTGVAPSLAPPMDSCFTNMTTSVVIWRGLSREATVTVRAVGGFEVVVQPDSPSRTFVGSPSPFQSSRFAAVP